MRYFFSALYILVLILSYLSQDKINEVSIIDKAINRFISDKSLQNASISFQVVDIENDSVLAAYHPQLSLVPASTMKLITTATSLNVLGPEHQFKTSLTYDGFIDTSGVLHGNIYIKGGGDPTLGSKYYPEKEYLKKFGEAIMNLGIETIEGGVIADGSFFSYELVPATWSWGDIGNYYGAGVSGLSVNDNSVSLLYRSGKNVGDSTSINCMEPYVPEIYFINDVISSKTKRDEAYIFGAPYSNIRYARGEIPLKVEDFKVKASIHDPTYFVAFELESYLHKLGIGIKKGATTIRRLKQMNQSIEYKGNEFYEYSSENLSSIINWTNLISNNLFAEHIHRAIGNFINGNSTAFSSSNSIINFWGSKGLNTTGFYMNDGSGLSRYNALSASFLVDVLCYMKKKSNFYSILYNSLPIAGKSGTLKSFGRGTVLEGNLSAKSGSMQRVRSYAGYLDSKSGKKLAFTIIVNNYNCTGQEIKKKIEVLLVAVRSFSY